MSKCDDMKNRQWEANYMMTLDEAIDHCGEGVNCYKDSGCAVNHSQLAEWLKELKTLRRQKQDINNKEKKQLAFIVSVLVKVIISQEITDSEIQLLENISYELRYMDLEEDEFRY